MIDNKYIPVVLMTVFSVVSVSAAAIGSPEVAAMLLFVGKVFLYTLITLAILLGFVVWLDRRDAVQGEIQFDKEMFDRVRPAYWRASREATFHGVLSEEEVERAMAYYAKHKDNVHGWIEFAEGPVVPTNERLKWRPIEWEPGHWVWFLESSGLVEWEVNQKGIIEEAIKEVPQEKKETGTIEFEYNRDEAIEKWERNRGTAYVKDKDIIIPD